MGHQPQIAPSATSAPHGLARRLTAFDTLSLVAGSVIGVGIFLMPNQVATLLPSRAGMLAIWTLAGVVSLFGALAIAELGVMYPHAGGLYVYLREAYGERLAFLYGWALLVAIQTGNIASLAAALPIYLGYLLPLPAWAVKPAGIAAIVILTAANCIGVRRGAFLQNLLTAIKLATLGLMTLLLLFARAPAAAASQAPPADTWTWSSLGLAAIAVLYAYECWHLVTFAAGEVIEPEKNLPRGLIGGMALVIVLYVAANAGYLHVLSVSAMQSNPYVAASALEAVVGRSAALLVSGMIVFSVLGAMNGLVLSGPRVYYAMARDRVFFARLAEVSPRFQVPVWAIVFQGALAVVLVLVGSFAQLVGYAISSAWVFYALAVLAVWRLRRRNAAGAGFRCPLYPLLASVFVAFATFIVLSQVVRNPGQSAIAAAVILIGLPIYGLWSRRKTRLGPAGTSGAADA